MRISANLDAIYHPPPRSMRLRAISRGCAYGLEKVIRFCEQTESGTAEENDNKKSWRWDVLVVGEEYIHPDLACQICGENRIVLGDNGSHRRCCRCGTIFCRRNCEDSIDGQCPRCGETDKIDAVINTSHGISTASTAPPYRWRRPSALVCTIWCQSGSTTHLGGLFTHAHTTIEYKGALRCKSHFPRKLASIKLT